MNYRTPRGDVGGGSEFRINSKEMHKKQMRDFRQFCSRSIQVNCMTAETAREYCYSGPIPCAVMKNLKREARRQVVRESCCPSPIPCGNCHDASCAIHLLNSCVPRYLLDQPRQTDGGDEHFPVSKLVDVACISFRPGAQRRDNR